MVTAREIAEVLPTLARERPVFHSEADFQLAYALAVRDRTGAEIRLETRPFPGVHLDMLVTDRSSGSKVAVELKYFTTAWQGDVAGEPYTLKDHSAHDLGRYDFMRDVARVERYASEVPNSQGLVVAVTNDPHYWQPASGVQPTNDAAFRLHEGTALGGTLVWGTSTGAGTMLGREDEIVLAGTYTLHWNDYSDLGSPHGRFRFLAVRVDWPARHVTASRHG